MRTWIGSVVGLLLGVATATTALGSFASGPAPAHGSPGGIPLTKASALTAKAYSAWHVSYEAGVSANVREASEDAARILSSVIVGNVPITVGILCRTGFGGSPNGAYYPDDPALIPGLSYPAALANQIAGRRLRDNTDIVVASDCSSALPVDTLIPVLVHEFIHGLGFVTGNSCHGGIGEHGTFVFATFLVTASGVPLTSMTDGTAELGKAVVTTAFWSGKYGSQANGGQRPTLWANGVCAEVANNLSHLGGAVHPTSVMSYGGSSMVLDPVVLGMLRDLGYIIMPTMISSAVAPMLARGD